MGNLKTKKVPKYCIQCGMIPPATDVNWMDCYTFGEHKYAVLDADKKCDKCGKSPTKGFGERCSVSGGSHYFLNVKK